MASTGKIVHLRALLAERFPSVPPPHHDLLVTGLHNVDGSIGGGLPKGSITELISPHVSAGSASFIASLVLGACRAGYFLALIDGADSFDPQPVGNRALRHLLWLRCRTAVEAMKGADLLLRDGNLPLVMIDLVMNPAAEVRKIPQTSWYRLQRLVENTSTAFVVLTRCNTVGSAQLKILLESAWDLDALQREDPASFLRMRVRRAHGSIKTIAG
jgi:hypothetical protein